MEFATWLAFFVASWLISISPGAGAVYAMSSGLTHGFRRGYVATIGLIMGIWTLLLIVALGVGALLASSSLAFQIIECLVWLIFCTWALPNGGRLRTR